MRKKSVKTTAKSTEAITETAAKVKETVKAAAKTTAKKATKKAAAKKTAKAEKKELVPEVFVQFDGNEDVVANVIERAKEAFTADGHRASSIKSLKVYLKPEEYAAYYVINDTYAGKVNLFQFYFAHAIKMASEFRSHWEYPKVCVNLQTDVR